MNNPKVFISYSWSSPEHEQRVLNIAKELVEKCFDEMSDMFIGVYGDGDAGKEDCRRDEWG